jgi:hypothetical protein
LDPPRGGWDTEAVLAALDWLLAGLHVVFILGFLSLWIPRSTVLLHRWLVGLTAFSWLVLGWFEGFGYCVLTDLEWRVKHARGIRHLPGSFIKYAVDSTTGLDVPPAWVDRVAATAFVLACAAALWRLRQERTLGRAARRPPDGPGEARVESGLTPQPGKVNNV